MRRLLLTGVLVAGALSGFVQGGTVAYFTGSATSTGNQFTARTLDISNSPASAALTASGLVPGGKTTAPLTVTNSASSVDSRYALSSSVTNDDTKGKGLGAQLTLKIKLSVTDCDDEGFDTSGTLLYTGSLGSLSGELNLIGNRSVRPNGGRSLASGTSEVLCFQVELPAGTGASYQNAETTATFNFWAEQL